LVEIEFNGCLTESYPGEPDPFQESTDLGKATWAVFKRAFANRPVY